MDGCTDGTFKATGKKHFTCAHGKGLYFPLASLRPDGRFEDAFTPQDNRTHHCKFHISISLCFSMSLQLFKLQWKNKQTRLSMILISR